MNIGIYEKLRGAIKDYHIRSCAIRSKNCIYITFENHPEKKDADIKFCAGLFYPKTERVWSGDLFTNIYRGKSCVVPGGPAVVVDFNGKVISQTGEISRETGFESEKRLPLLNQVAVNQVREIDGKAYMAGGLRTVFRREGPGKWTCLSGNDLAVRDEEDRQKRDFGFEDIDGFAANDIYACGGKGDICHYNGQEWDEIDCPTNITLLSICCAGNGKVYAGGIKGVLLEGRGDKWKVVDNLGADWMNVWITSLAWYKGKLYLATDRGLYEYHDGKIVKSPGLTGLSLIPDEESADAKSKERIKKMLVKAGADKDAVELATTVSIPDKGILAPSGLHTLSTDGELLVLGGSDKVAVFDGLTWGILYASTGINMGGSL